MGRGRGRRVRCEGFGREVWKWVCACCWVGRYKSRAIEVLVGHFVCIYQRGKHMLKFSFVRIISSLCH